MDSLRITGIRAWGRHGILPSEHRHTQPYVVDVTLFLDLSKAGAQDSLADTVDYGQVASLVASVIEKSHGQLIEALAEQIAQAILRINTIRRVIVTVHKPQAPLRVPFTDVNVTIERSRIAHDGGQDGEISSQTAHETEISTQSSSSHTRPRVHRAIISMGGNIGDVRRAMREAIVAMDGITGNQIMGISPLYRTTPWGMDGNAPDFYNAVVELDTILDTPGLLKALQLIEAAHGRSHAVHWGSRPLDLDIIDFDHQVSDDPSLTLPHPRAWQRAFVLAPLADLEPDAVLPGEHGGAVADLLAACPDKDTVHRVSDDWIVSGGNEEE
jgi:dihydroneopterin aldolase/2-amino-4-hydroxy-6-hydroxymethyldihydropteridine diphosphokinase